MQIGLWMEWFIDVGMCMFMVVSCGWGCESCGWVRMLVGGVSCVNGVERCSLVMVCSCDYVKDKYKATALFKTIEHVYYLRISQASPVYKPCKQLHLLVCTHVPPFKHGGLQIA